MGRADYTPYGRLILNTIPTTLTNRLYTGQRYESDLEIYDYQARFYDPLVGSFLSPDSLVPEPGRPAAWNRYSYVYGNPVRFSDPSGHCIVGYSGEVRMGQAPYGTSGVCPHTSSWHEEAAYNASALHNEQVEMNWTMSVGFGGILLFPLLTVRAGGEIAFDSHGNIIILAGGGVVGLLPWQSEPDLI